jgi:hypothetical protein
MERKPKMFRKPTLPFLGLAVTVVALAVGGTAVNGEIAKRGDAPVSQAHANAAPRLAADTPLSVECWQEGQKIISQDKLYGFTVSSLIDSSSVSFRRAPRGNANVFIVSLKHSTCLIRDASRSE